jgi:Zn-dependent peptidase ImmA (M78 family)
MLKFVKVGEDIYTVHTDNLKKKEDAQGFIDVDAKEITIDIHVADTPPSNRLVTLFHELAHAVANHFDLESLCKSEDLLDHLCEVSARGLVMLMRDNPCLFRDALDSLQVESKKREKEK